MTPSNEMPIDPSVVASLRALQDPGQPDLLTELIDLFLDDAPARIAAVHDAIRGAASLGTVRLAALSAELEQMGKSGSVDGAATVEPKLARTYDRVATALLQERRPM